MAVGRITREQTKKYLEELSRRRRIPELGARLSNVLTSHVGAHKAVLFDKVTARIVTDGLKKNFFRSVSGSWVGRTAKNYTDEALEEGLDEFAPPGLGEAQAAGMIGGEGGIGPQDELMANILAADEGALAAS